MIYIIKGYHTSKMYLSKRNFNFFTCQKDANKKKVTQTTKNDERTAKTHKNPNGNPRPKLQRETNTPTIHSMQKYFLLII